MLRKSIAILLVCLLLPLACFAESVAPRPDGELQWIDVPINTPVSKTQLHWDFPYSDALFAAPAKQYNHQLAQSSLGLAIAAFRQKDAELPEKDKAVRQYLLDAGFGALASEEYDVEPSVDTIATLIGSKQVDGATLVAVAVSGGDYQKEWESNFRIGVRQYDDGEAFHDGFAQAAANVVARVMFYLHDHSVTGPIKLWLTGYSRAAAVSNLTAYALLESGVATDENLYAYTFATPRCMANTDVPECASIFNIVGSFDPVPAVPFEEWGYDRYGNTLYLPAQELCPDYADRKTAVEPIYKQLTGLDYWNNPQSNWFCCKAMQTLDDMMRNAEDYRSTLQQIVLNAMNLTGSWLSRAIRVYEMIAADTELTQKLSDVWFYTCDLYSTAAYSLFRQKLGMEENLWNHGVSVMVELIHEHCPDVYVAWMFSQSDPERLFITEIDYHRLLVAGDVDVTVADAQGVPLDSVVSFALGDSRLYTIPADVDRVATLTARADTKLDVLTIGRKAQSLNARVLVWNTSETRLPLKAGESLTLGFPSNIEADTSAYTASTDGLRVGADTKTMEIKGAFAEMDTVDSGDAAHGFLRTLMWSVAILLALLLALIVFGVVRLVRRIRRKRAAKRLLA